MMHIMTYIGIYDMHVHAPGYCSVQGRDTSVLSTGLGRASSCAGERIRFLLSVCPFGYGLPYPV